MRTPPDPDDPHDIENLQELNAPSWMLELLYLNPSYPHWGPYEDYMADATSSWTGRMIIESWKDHQINLDDWNEVVHFYFYVDRDHEDCCCQAGWSQIAQDMQNEFSRRARSGMLRDDQLLLLQENNRLGTKDASIGEMRSLVKEPFVFDAISRHILIEYECKKIGVSMLCSSCHGKGYLLTDDPAYVSLVYWLLHPRKGASRGVHVKHIEQEDLPEVFKFLKQAADRNAQRFQAVIDRTKRGHG